VELDRKHRAWFLVSAIVSAMSFMYYWQCCALVTSPGSPELMGERGGNDLDPAIHAVFGGVAIASGSAIAV
jgi:hypothetical protein